MTDNDVLAYLNSQDFDRVESIKNTYVKQSEYSDSTPIQSKKDIRINFDDLLKEHLDKVGNLNISDDGEIITFYTQDLMHKYLKLKYDGNWLVVVNSHSKKTNRTCRTIRLSLMWQGKLLETIKKFIDNFVACSYECTYSRLLLKPVIEEFVIGSNRVSFQAEADKTCSMNIIKIFIYKDSEEETKHLYQWIKLEAVTDLIHLIAVIIRLNEEIRGI